MSLYIELFERIFNALAKGTPFDYCYCKRYAIKISDYLIDNELTLCRIIVTRFDGDRFKAILYINDKSIYHYVMASQINRSGIQAGIKRVR